MTGFIDCLTTATVKGLLDQGKADEAVVLFNDMVEELKARGISENNAKIKAAEMARDQVGYKVERQKKMLVLGNTARNRILADMRAYRKPDGSESYADAAIGMIERDEFSTSTNFSGRKEVILGEAHKRMSDLLEKYGPKKAGTVRPKAGLENVVREIFGENTGDASAKELAQAWKETADYLKQRANTAGSDIKTREDWHFQQTHDWVKVSKAGKKAWIEHVMGRADFDRMYHPDTGRPMSRLDASERYDALSKAYDTIKTQGYVNMEGSASGQGSLARRMSEPRFLQFRDSKAWLEYQDKFGSGNAFDAMVNHVEHMSQQIAMLETFGPNPEMMRRYIHAQVLKRAGEIDANNPEPAKRSHVAEQKKTLRRFDAMWNTATNQNALLNGDWMGFTLAGLRNILTAAHLGSASLVAIPGDFLAVKMTKKFNRMDSTKFVNNYMKLMNPANEADRKLAVRLNLINEAASSIAFGQQRLIGQITGPQFTRRISDVVMRLTLMTPHTQAGRWAFGMEFLGMLADYSGKSFDEMPIKETFRRYGITAQEWEAIRKTPLYEERGATFLRPDDIINNSKLPPSQAQALADKMMEMVLGESRVAIQEPTIRARSTLIGDTKPGTLIGELGRSAAMFKNFPVTLMMVHWRRNLLNASMGGSKFGYAAAFGLGLTGMGALSMQLKQITQGKDPMNMNPATPEGRTFWGNAVLTGGGLGFWGDFLVRDINRFGGGPAEAAAGPVVGFVGDTAKLTIGNALEVAQGKDTNFLGESVQYMRRYMPGGSTWYARAILQRAVFDQLQEMADPKAHQKWRRQKTRIRNDYGQKFYWRPGDVAPARAPDFGAAWKK